MKTLFKTVLYLAVVAILVAAGWYAWKQSTLSDSTATAESITTTKVNRESIRREVSATGRVEPERVVEIKSKASGEVQVIYVDVSDPVEKGQLLFRLDPVDEERSVKRLAASLTMSEARLEQVRLGVAAGEAKLQSDRQKTEAGIRFAEADREDANTRLRRSQELHSQNVITREDLDSANTRAVQAETNWSNAVTSLQDLEVQAFELDKLRHDIPIAEAQVENDRISLADAEQRLRETELYSPISGVVSERNIQDGFIVSSGISNVGGGTTALKIVDLSRVYAIAAVDEADIGGITPGVRAVITADSHPNRQFRGKVVRVATTGTVESNVVTFDVKVEVEGDGKSLLKPEMTTNVRLLVAESPNALTLPVEAVGFHLVHPTEGGGRPQRQAVVKVRLASGEVEERPVETGITDGTRMEITAGLNEGDNVEYDKNQLDDTWAGRGQRGIRLGMGRGR
ncbi:MAG: efflux RND transporter periplasmic adaptor subunit [Planctomycetota bacterium]|jgi:HlyD family secretion protein|nr:efflux RND transporter periplasmic adaptor subunit [Planctomycetota bacterium]